MFSFLNIGPSVKEKLSPYTPKNNWMIVRKLMSQRCGEHFLVQNTSTGEVIMKKIIFKDAEDKAHSLLTNLKTKRKNQNPHVLQLLDYDIIVKKEFCSKSFYFSIYYDYPDDDLESLLLNQINSNKSISGEHLLKITYNVILGLKYLQNLSQNRDSGLLQLNRIYYNSNSNDYRVIENITNKNIYDFYFDLLISKKSISVFSPETISKKFLINKNFDVSKIDSFNLGMIILCLGINEKPKVFFSKNAINVPLLNVKIDAFAEKYRMYGLLCDLLRDLLEMDINKRPSLSDVLLRYPESTDLQQYQRSTINTKSKISNPMKTYKRKPSVTQRSSVQSKVYFFN